MINSRLVFNSRPPSGTGVQFTRVRPAGTLPYNVWLRGHIEQFCPDEDAAFAFLNWVFGGTGGS